jgi:hypothetical protein
MEAPGIYQKSNKKIEIKIFDHYGPKSQKQTLQISFFVQKSKHQQIVWLTLNVLLKEKIIVIYKETTNPHKSNLILSDSVINIILR